MDGKRGSVAKQCNARIAFVMALDTFDSAAFLRETWQRQPLLIRGAWTDWRNPIGPDDLAGLACAEIVESRLIVQGRATLQVEPGPIPEKRFGKLGKKPWTLLVQAVDHYVPAVAAVIEAFRFVPNWRIDDVMVSYATDGGGVGPHFDQYDVFLIQGLGRRRWQVGARCDDDTELLPHDDLRLLADFQPTAEWVLEPGDMLYVPPRFAHNGVAVGEDCMTYSIGFRAPSRGELIAHYCDHVLSELTDDDRYADPGLAAQCNPGEISASALDRLHAMVAETLADRAAFARWFGTYTTTPKYADFDWELEPPISGDAVRSTLAAGGILRRNPASRFAFVRDGAGVILFVDGEAFGCAGTAAVFAEALCRSDVAALDRAQCDDDATIAVMTRLLNAGRVTIE
jgi:50S ribosomal protein L16 3-hydroxylase